MCVEGKIVVVTGASGFLGGHVTMRLAAEGATVAGLDRVARAEAAVEAVDLLDAEAVHASFRAIAKRHGRIDALINIAGGFAWQTVADGALAAWDDLYRINLRTAVATSQAALPYLPRPGGRIVNIGAAAAIKAGVGMAAYAASKAGVAKLTEGLAEELKGEGITVNAVLPSIIDTPTNRANMPDANASDWVPADHIAALIAFLLGDDAASITGALIPVTARV